MKRALAICLYRRVEEANRIMGAIKANPELASLPAYVGIDYHDNQTWSDLARSSAEHFDPICVVSALRKVGCNQNLKRTIGAAFRDGAEFVLMVEDDVLLSADAGQWVNWASEKYKDDARVLTVGMWEHGRRQPDANPMACRKQQFFTCWGWGTWADRWKEIEANWTTGGDHERSWDVALETLRGRTNRYEAVPLVSRAQNIGSRFGTHRGDCILPVWQPDRTSGEYVEA